MKKYIDILNPSRYFNKICIELRYDIGGYNYFTHKTDERGYYLSVTPLNRYERDGVTFEEITAFTGIKTCIKPVTRKSNKAAQEAEKLIPEHLPDLLLYVCNKHNLIINERFYI